MAQFSLPAATSVVDFLNSQGKDSSFGARSKLYAEAGIDKRLGSFSGSSSQNLALLDHLKTPAPTPAPAPAGASAIMTRAQTSTPQTAVQPAANLLANPTPSSPTDFSRIPFERLNVNPRAPGGNDGFIDLTPPAAPAAPAQATANMLAAPSPGAPDFTKLAMSGAAPALTAPATSAAQTIAPSAPATPAPSSTGTGSVKDTSGTVSNTLYPSTTKSEGDLIDQFMNSAEGQAVIDKQQRGELDAEQANAESKRLLEAKYASDKTTLENNLAKAGLAFSGVRSSQVKALADELAASSLNLDRQLASKLLDADANLRDSILKGVADLVKAADAKDKEAIQQLNAVGLAVVNGELVPTLAARNADRAAAQQEVANARAQANFELQERRLALSEQAAVRAEERFQQLYGSGKGDVFNYAKQLFELNPTATPVELRAALMENNPSASASEVDAAMNLLGVPKGLQPNIAIGYVTSSFTNPGILFRTDPKANKAALEKAKTDAKAALVASGGTITVNTGTNSKPKYVSYNVTTDQLNTLAGLIDTVTLDDVKGTK